MDTSKDATIRLARAYADRGDPDGWFEEFYARAEGDVNRVYWADLAPHPLLLDWLGRRRPRPGERAAVVGCGLGDDAEAMARHSWEVTAFDVSRSAIDMCRRRFPGSQVDYRVADLFAPPAAWRRGFTLIFECNTVQILTGANRRRCIEAIADLTEPGGTLLVSCRSRETDGPTDTFPVALDRDEIDGFRRAGLDETAFTAYDDDQEPSVPHFFAEYRRPAAG